jgi:hypothetical protein
MENQLPIWEGLTVDERLREFRCFDEDGNLETCPFDSVEGAFLYAAYKGTIRLELATTPSGLTYMRPQPVKDGEEGGVDLAPATDQ